MSAGSNSGTRRRVADALKRLSIRGAPLIGVAAGYGVALELALDQRPDALPRARELLVCARPTAVNLAYAVRRVADAAAGHPPGPERAAAALAEARAIERQEIASSDALATHGADLLCGLDVRRVLTHCNTGRAGRAGPRHGAGRDRRTACPRRARAGARRRDAAAVAGRAADRLRARPPRDRARGDRRRRRRRADRAWRGRCGGPRLRPGRGQRRCRQQGRHLRARARGAGRRRSRSSSSARARRSIHGPRPARRS